MDLNKLKVPELRKELQTRGLDSKGNKPVLIERLREAIEKENAEQDESENEEEVAESSEENSLMYTTAESENAAPPPEAPNEERAFSVITSAASTELDSSSADAVDDQPVTTEKSQPRAVSAPVDQSIDDASASASVDQSIDDASASAPVDQSIDDASVDGAESTQENYDSDSLQQTYELESTTTEQEAEPTKEAVSELNQTADQDQSTFDYGQSNDSSQSYGYSSNQETTGLDLAVKREEVRNVNEETMDVAESTDVPKEGSWPQENANTFSGQNFITPQKDEEAVEESVDTEMKEITASESTTDQEKLETGESTTEGESADAATTEDQMDTQENAEEPKKRIRKSRFDQPDENNTFDQSEDGEGSRYDEDRKRRHSPSPSGHGANTWSNYEAPAKIPKEDDEPSFNDEVVLLSWYDSDLNLTISKENFLSGAPLHDVGFMYMWAGARSTYGFQSGKVYYDVKLVEKSLVNVVDEFEIYSFRLGWSVAYSSLQLGEVPFSYGYDSSGKKCVDNNFEDYGQPFNAEDIIGCLIDFDSNEENVLISYTFNGTDQGVAFEVPKEQLEGKALFPHVLSKNISFEVNFGEREDGWNLEEKFTGDFVWASKVALENRVKGPRKPEEKKQCEIVMMCGLPCSGKTTWIKKHVEEFPEKMYNVVGIDSVLSKMKVLNESIETYYKEKDDMNTLTERCTKCMNRIFELACIRWRNYILDQTNVFLSVQRRKMRSLEGFTRLAVVVLPKEEEYEKYLEKWDENVLRDNAISLLELKSNFRLPEEGELFDSVVFEGTTREEAEELIKKYNKEGRDARQRDDRGFNRGGFYRDDRYGRPMGGGFRSGGRWMDRGPPSIGRGGWAPRGGMDRMGPGGFRDRRNNWRDREDDRDGGYRGGRYGPRGGQGQYGGMMGGNRWGGGGRDRDRMGGPGSRGPPGSGPNPLMGSLVGKPGGYGGERKSRFDDKRDGDEFERRVGPPGVDEEGGEESIDKGGLMGDDDRKRYSRFSDSPGGGFRGGRGGGGGFRGRGGGSDRGGDRNMGGGGRFGGGQFRPNNGAGPRGGGGGFNRNRDDGGGRFYGGRGGGPPGRDGRDNRNPMNNQRQGGGMNSRFDKRDGSDGSGNKNDSNSGNQQQQSAWGMYGGQGGWNQYQWAQYQQAGYSPQQIQQYWSQLQQQQQQQAQNSGAAPSGQQGSKSGPAGAVNSTNTQSNAGNNTSSTQQSGNNAGYTTQGYNAQGYNVPPGYDANSYAQYCANYYSQLAAQGWSQNADGSYAYPQNAWAQYAGYNNYNAAAAAGGAAGSGSSGGANTGSSVTTASSNAAVTSK